MISSHRTAPRPEARRQPSQAGSGPVSVWPIPGSFDRSMITVQEHHLASVWNHFARTLQMPGVYIILRIAVWPYSPPTCTDFGRSADHASTRSHFCEEVRHLSQPSVHSSGQPTEPRGRRRYLGGSCRLGLLVPGSVTCVWTLGRAKLVARWRAWWGVGC